MKNIIYFTYHRSEPIDFEWLKAAMRSVRKVAVADIIVVTDNMPAGERDVIKSKFKPDIQRIKSSEWDGRRTLCRLEQTDRIVQRLSPEGTRLIQSDIDVLFLKNPFVVFDEMSPDTALGVTRRMYDYHVSVNSGLVFFKVTDNVKRYTKWAVEQAKNPTWWPYLMLRGQRNNVDWGCDQDMVNAVYRNDGWIKHEFGFYVKDVGYEWNYCAGTDVLGFEPAAYLMRRALKVKDYSVLHFKGQYLKKLINEPCMKEYRG